MKPNTLQSESLGADALCTALRMAATFFAEHRDDRATMFTHAWLSIVELQRKEHPRYEAQALELVTERRYLRAALRNATLLVERYAPGDIAAAAGLDEWRKLL